MDRKKEFKKLIKELQREGKVVLIQSLEDDKIVIKDNELKK